MTEPAIRDFHAHIYYDPAEVERARALAAAVQARFPVAVGHFHLFCIDIHRFHFGEHDLGRVLTVFPGRSAADLRRAIEERSTSPISGSVSPSPPPLRMRAAQQYRSMVWLAGERRAGRVGGGAGPAGQ